MLAGCLDVCVREGAGLFVIDSLGIALEGDAGEARDVILFHKKYLDPFRENGMLQDGLRFYPIHDALGTSHQLFAAKPKHERELEVLTLLASGRANSEIARALFVAVGTVKSHVSNIYRKLDARNHAEAVTRARELNLLR